MDDYGDIFSNSVEDDYGEQRENLKSYEYEEFKETPMGGVSIFSFGDEDEDTRTEAEKALGIKKEKAQGPKKRTIAERLREQQLKPHKYTQKEIERFREESKNALVRDWGEGDRYHISEEDKANMDELNTIRNELNSVKSTYYYPEPFIKAMRIVMKAWNIYAENNGIYSYDEFMKKVADGRIVSPAIIEPRLRYINKYNIERLAKFIADPSLDPKDFIPRENVNAIKEFLNDEDINEKFDRYVEEFMNTVDEDLGELDPDELEMARENAIEYAANRLRAETMKKLASPELMDRIISYEFDPKPMTFQYLPNRYIKAYNNKSSAIFTGKKKVDIKKRDRKTSKDINGVLKRVAVEDGESANSYSTAAFLNSKFIPRKKYTDLGVQFNGSQSKWDAIMNEVQLDYIMMNMHPIDEPTYTYQRKYMGQIVKYLEDQGVNTTDISRRLYGIESPDTGFTRKDIRAQKISNRKNEKKVLEKVLGLTKNKRIQKLIAKREDDLENYNDEVDTYD